MTVIKGIIDIRQHEHLSHRDIPVIKDIKVVKDIIDIREIKGFEVNFCSHYGLAINVKGTVT